MFDDQPQNLAAGAPPKNLPVEPEDMFADVDAAPAAAPAAPNALSAGLLKPKAPAPAGLMPAAVSTMPRDNAAAPSDVHVEPVSYDTRQPIAGKLIAGLVGLVAVVGLVFAGWWVYNRFLGSKTTTTAINTNTTTQIKETVVPTTQEPAVTETLPTANNSNSNGQAVSSTVAEMHNNELLFGEKQDSDSDGLDDKAESQLGTNVNIPDSDQDKLCDGDEVLIWKTNPSLADTDADKHPDGTEVYNGYNPNGPGKLGPLPTTVTTSTACQSGKK